MARAWSRRRALVTLAALAAVGFALLSRFDAPRAEPGAWLRRTGVEARQAQVGRRRLRYVRAGRGASVVLVHGFASSIYTWSEVLPTLAREHDVVALDLPGFGGSEMPADLHWTELPEAVLGLMDGLGLGRASLVGHSLGGAVVVAVAAARPERVERLALLDSAGFNLDDGQRPKLVGAAGSPLVGALLSRLPLRRALLRLGLRQVFHDHARLTPEREEEYLHPLRRPEWLRAMPALLASRGRELQAFPDLLRRVRAPAVVVWGREDAWIPVTHAARFQELLPGARTVILEACGHVPQEERPLETLRELRAHLSPRAP